MQIDFQSKSTEGYAAIRQELTCFAKATTFRGGLALIRIPQGLHPSCGFWHERRVPPHRVEEVLVVIILLNMLLAVIMDNYMMVKSLGGKAASRQMPQALCTDCGANGMATMQAHTCLGFILLKLKPLRRQVSSPAKHKPQRSTSDAIPTERS